MPGLALGDGRPKKLLSKYLRHFCHHGVLIFPLIWLTFTYSALLGSACHCPLCSLAFFTCSLRSWLICSNFSLIHTLPEMRSRGQESCRGSLGLIIAVDWIVFPSNSHSEALTPKVTVSGNRAFEGVTTVKWGHKGEALIQQDCGLRTKESEISHSLCHMRTQQESDCPWATKRTPDHADPRISDFRLPALSGNKCLLVKPPACSILLQSKQTETVTHLNRERREGLNQTHFIDMRKIEEQGSEPPTALLACVSS